MSLEWLASVSFSTTTPKACIMIFCVGLDPLESSWTCHVVMPPWPPIVNHHPNPPSPHTPHPNEIINPPHRSPACYTFHPHQLH